MDSKELYALFETHSSEHLKFESIDTADRRHPMPDICAFLYLYERRGAQELDGNDMVCSPEHDQYWINFDCSVLTESDVIYLLRCGILFDYEHESLFSFA